jgi:hypothetical protein
MSANMGNIELNMAILTGAVGGVLLIGAEMAIMSKKVGRYREHLRVLYKSRRMARLGAEIGVVAAIALVQPVIIAMLTVSALGSFNPAFSANAAQQLKGEPTIERPLRNEPHGY